MGKKLGYALLVCGICLLTASGAMMWKVSYGTMEGPQAFAGDAPITMTMPNGASVSFPVPPQVNKFGNLALGFLLMFFLAVVGGKIGSLGVKLINGPAVHKEPAPK